MKYFIDWIERDRLKEEAQRREEAELKALREQALREMNDDPSWSHLHDHNEGDDNTDNSQEVRS